MLQNFYRFNVYIFMFTNEIRPYKSYADHCKQTFEDTHLRGRGRIARLFSR